MGGICVILAVLITILVLMVGSYNDVPLNIAIMYTDKTYEISFLVLTLITLAFGILVGVLLMLSSFFSAQSRYSKLKKQYEKTSVGADGADDRIKLLENKISTLEAALKKAMEN